MDLTNFARDVEKALARAEALSHRVDQERGADPEMLAELLAELLTATEELRVAEEELRAQNDHLAAARELLEAERQNYKDLFELAPDAYLVTDLSGVIREANQAASMLLNLSPKLLAGKPLVTFIPEEERRAFRSQLLALGQQDALLEWELALRPRGNERVVTSARVGLIYDWKGERIGFRWILHDITPYSEIVEKLHTLRKVQEEGLAGQEAEWQAALTEVQTELAEEHRARLRAEALHGDLRFLVSLSGLLLNLLEPETLLKELVDFCVPGRADWCAIDVRDTGHLRRAASAHHDPAKTQDTAQLLNQFPPKADSVLPLMRVLEKGEVVYLPEGPEWSEETDAHHQEEQTALKALGAASCILLPLQSNSEVLGVFTLARGAASPLYTEKDRLILEVVGRYAAQALDHVYRYQLVRLENLHHRRTEETLQQQHHELNAQNTRLQQRMVETHHRVKNNLQALASLVELQNFDRRQELQQPDSQRLLMHIRTLAALHELLTASSHMAEPSSFLDGEEMLNHLVSVLSQIGVSNLILSAQKIDLTFQQGTALALLTSELVSNAVKHGGSSVTVNFLMEGDYAALEVADGGPGFPEDFSPEHNSHTGLELIEHLARFDLSGIVRYENLSQGGAMVRVIFPLQKSKSQSSTLEAGETISPQP